MYRLVALKVHKEPLNGNNPLVSLDVASSRHTLSTLKVRSPSVVIDIVIELPIINYLNFEVVLFDGLIAFLAFPPGSFSGLDQDPMVTHFNYYT